MRITEMDTLFNYNWWATSQVLDAATGLADTDFQREDVVPVPYGSLRGTLIHMLDMERSARFRLSRNLSVEPFDRDQVQSVSKLAPLMRAEATAMKDFLIGLEDEHMDSLVALEDGTRWPYWQLLMHVIQHSAHHRAEAALLLMGLDRPPGELDFFAYLTEVQR